MSKIYNYNESSYYGGDSRRSSMDEYLERVDIMQRTPNVIDDFSMVPQARSFDHHKPENHHHRQIEISHAKPHRDRAPEIHKKVHFTEHQKIVDIDRKGKHEVYEEKTIDVEADGFIQQQHKSFESCNTVRRY